MKLSSLLIAGSLVANASMIAALLVWHPASTETKSSRSIESPSPASLASDPQQKTNAATPAGRTWDRLFNGDLATLPDRLRAAGFPPATVRAIVTALVVDKFSSRRRAIEANAEKPYWKGRSDAYDPKLQGELNSVEREQNEFLKKLLGVDPADDSRHDSRWAMIQEFGRELPTDTLKRVRELQSSFGDRYSKVSSEVGTGTYLPSDMEKMRELQNQLHSDLAKILSVEELLEYDLRNSSTAGSLRFALDAMRPTEVEFRALYPLYRTLDEQFPYKPGRNSPEDLAPRQAAEKAMQDQIKAALGPERYAEFEKSKDYNYQQTAKVTGRLGLATATTAQVFAVQQETQQRAAALRVDRTLSADDRTARLAALANDASAKISTVLGTSGLEAYKEYAGQWLQQLQPRPRPPNTRAP